MHKVKYNQEENIIRNILYNNSFPIQLQKFQNTNKTRNKTHKQKHQHQNGPLSPTLERKPHRSPKYSNKLTKIAYCTNNTIQDNLVLKTQNHDKLSSSGVYKLTCPDCGRAYIEQTGRILPKDTMNTDEPTAMVVILPNLHNT